jgi:high-affinity nickel permease
LKSLQRVRTERPLITKGVSMPYVGTYPARRGSSVSLLMVVYLVAGGIVAATHHYWSNLHTVKAIISAVLATILWPLLLVGVDLHIR